METTTSKFARRYDREFKQDAVALVTAGRTITEEARSLGVSHWSLTRWVNLSKSGAEHREPGTLAAESSEQREMRRYILKKALGIVSAEMPGGALS